MVKTKVILLAATLLLIGGCSNKTAAEPTPMPTPTPALTATPIPSAPVTSAVSVVTDPSLQEISREDPYAQIAGYTLEAHHPDEALYNALFHAIDRMETTVDISAFPLSLYEKVVTCDSLYEQAGLQFYYMNRIRVSEDGNSVSITYTETGEEAEKNKELFYAKLNHLVYNVAPEHYSPLQRLFSVYDSICTVADYTDDIQDSSTHTAYSILMNGKGICGGFASLGYSVLNRAGIPTAYISNEPHAWNMVELDGKNYHTDMTWGAGSYGSGSNSIRTILMDDEQRNLGLENAGFGGYAIIEGIPRENPAQPLPAENKEFKAYYDLYFEHALDIENNRVYYYDGEGIKKMTLDGKELEIVSPMSATYLTAFNGTLYFINMDNRHLYKLQPGQEAQLLDGTAEINSLSLKNGILYYESLEGSTATEKSLNLNPFAASNFDLAKSEHQTSITVPRQQSFKFELQFSTHMGTNILPREAVALVNSAGEVLPTHMYWSDDGRTLTVRPQVSLDKESAVSLYVAPGIGAADGNVSEEMYDITVQIQ